MAGSFNQSLAPGTVTGHISQERSLYVLIETALMNCCLLWGHSESQLLCTWFVLLPQFLFLALSLCHTHSLHRVFLWSLPSECIGFKAIYCILFLRLKLQVLERKWMKTLQAKFSWMFLKLQLLETGWMFWVCHPEKGWPGIVCIFIYLVLNKHFLCFNFLRVLIILFILLLIIT